MAKVGTRLNRFLFETERQHPAATGELSDRGDGPPGPPSGEPRVRQVHPEEGPRRFVEEWAREKDEATGRPYSTRYSGALVSDFHRIVLKGGIYPYPATAKSPQGKIRLMYEAARLALVAEAAGGAASNGRRRILEILPTQEPGLPRDFF